MIDVAKIAKLARLTLTDDEIKVYEPQLASILDLVDKLKKINTENVDPTYQVTGQENCWREDEVDLSRLLKLDKKFFKIAKIL